MRRQYFRYLYLVGSLVFTIYGFYSIFYSIAKDKDIPVLAIIFATLGSALLVLFLVFCIIDYVRAHKTVETYVPEVEKEDLKQDENIEKTIGTQLNETKVLEKPSSDIKKERVYVNNDERPTRTKIIYHSYDTVYVKQIGYGPVLRIEGNRILDMRTNTYYSFNGNVLNRDGSGPVFEISGNRIRKSFGSYLFELSGNNINKVFGGYYASFSGSYLQTYDLSYKYEITGAISNMNKLVIAALLFGEY